MTWAVLISGVLGLLAGPTLHGWAVAAGERRPLGGLAPTCRRCGSRRGWLRCPSCGHRGVRETLFPFISGALGAGTATVVGADPVLPAYLVYAAVTLVLVVTDFDHHLIPNRVLYPGAAAAVVLLAAGAVAAGEVSDLGRAALGGLVYFTVFFLVALVARGGFGFGDVKLAALLGVFTAYVSAETFLLGVAFTGLIGGVPALVLLLTRRAKATDEIPYGPAMILGSWGALAFGVELLLR